MASQNYDPADPGKPPRPWYKKKRFIIPAGLVGLLVLPGLLGGGDDTSSSTAAPAATTVAAPTVTPATPAPSATTTAPEPVKTSTAAKPTKYQAISARDFKLLVKDPDSFAGKAYRIYGVVTQFDAATGSNGFRADTGATKLKADDWYEFDQNSVLTGDESVLAEVVQDDLFQANVIVAGSYTYDTQIGGSTTVPAFEIQEISVYGSRD